jgi:hypothetical protein
MKLAELDNKLIERDRKIITLEKQKYATAIEQEKNVEIDRLKTQIHELTVNLQKKNYDQTV